ncbi:MAG: rod shape-determining protein RodA [Actinobacteria bacterium]|nr:rod shape-determining protein RodA [Actinomycetota bacterium]
MATRVVPHSARTPVAADAATFLRHLDYVLLAAVAGVIAYGLWVLSSVTQNDVAGAPDYYAIRQGINVGLGAIALAVAAAVNPEIYRGYRKPLYVALLAGLLVVFVTDAIRGTQRWIEIGFFRFQPSELGKVLVILVLAAFLAERAKQIDEWRTTLTAVGIVALPAFLVFIEPDFGTALIYAAALAAALVVAGTPWKHLVGLLALAAFASLAVLKLLPAIGIAILRPYQLERLTGFLNPDLDPSGTTYNLTQSILAIGSGGLSGRGVEGATQTNMNYLPEHQTDFIFSSLAEQRGFVGASILLLLFALIVWRGLKIVALAPSLFQATVAGSVVFALIFQIFVNIGMTAGIAPITGIPLPFVSYGGSSMITSLLMIGLLEAIHARGRLAGRS